MTAPHPTTVFIVNFNHRVFHAALHWKEKYKSAQHFFVCVEAAQFVSRDMGNSVLAFVLGFQLYSLSHFFCVASYLNNYNKSN